jgi:Fic family protein
VTPRVGEKAGVRGRDALSQRIRAEYLEMPGLCLTIEQAQRLWSVDRPTCEAAFRTLTSTRFLDRTTRGAFVLRAGRVRPESEVI